MSYQRNGDITWRCEPTGPDSFEPNDDAGSATALDLDPEGRATASGTLLPGSDDWFVVPTINCFKTVYPNGSTNFRCGIRVRLSGGAKFTLIAPDGGIYASQSDAAQTYVVFQQPFKIRVHATDVGRTYKLDIYSSGTEGPTSLENAP